MSIPLAQQTQTVSLGEPAATFPPPAVGSCHPSCANLFIPITRSNVSLGKYGTFNTRNLIGQPYGHTYEVLAGGQLKIVRATIAEVQETAANNQNILAQSVGLDNEAIQRMKAEGLSGRVSNRRG